MQLKLIAKRNIEIKRNWENTKEGIYIDPIAFEPEAGIIRRLHQSKHKNL